MEIKQLRRFLMVVERGSLAAAAPMLGLTQQALGASIAKLEDEMGVVLLDRGPGGTTTVTSYGALLVRHAKSMLAAADRARQELHAFRDARGGSVSIGIGEAFASEVIADAVRDFHRARPEVTISIIEDYSEMLLDRLTEGEIDFIAGADTTRPGDVLERFPLYTAEDIVIARASHPLARRRKLALRDLQPFTWMAPRSRPIDATIIAEAFRKQELEPPSRFIWTDARHVGMDLLLGDDYLFMTSPAMVTVSLRQKSIVALNIPVPTVERRAGLIFREETKLNPSAMALMDDIRSRTYLHVGELGYASPLNPGRKIGDAA